MFFTTNRTVTINGDIFSVYDLNLSTYTKSILLDGYNIRQFRIRHWPSSGDLNIQEHILVKCIWKRMIYSCQIEMD